MAREKDDDGSTKTSSFRLGPDVLADLDAVAIELTDKTGAKHNRTDAIRVLSKAGLVRPSIGPPAMMPHYGDIPCGEPIALADQPPAMMLDMAAMFRGPDRFLLTARGTSMTNKLIGDGDYLVIHRKSSAQHGEMVVAFVDGEATLKLYHIRKNGKKTEHWLMPASEHHEPRLIEPGADARILGVLVGVIRKY